MSDDHLEHYPLRAARIPHLVLETVIEQHDFAFGPASPLGADSHLCTAASVYAQSKMKLQRSVAAAEVWTNPSLGIYCTVARTMDGHHTGMP